MARGFEVKEGKVFSLEDHDLTIANRNYGDSALNFQKHLS